MCAVVDVPCLCNGGGGSAWQRRLQSQWRQISGSRIVCISLQGRDDRWREASRRFHDYGLCRMTRFYRPLKPDLQTVRKMGIESGGAYGCWTSHRRVARHLLQTAKPGRRSPTKPETGNLADGNLADGNLADGDLGGGDLGRALIFEDDVGFLPAAARSDGSERPTERDLKQFYTLLKRAADTVRANDLPAGWEMWYLGHCPMPFSAWPVTRSLIRTRSALMHAYVLSERGLARMGAADFLTFARDEGQETGIDIWAMKNLRQYATIPQLAVQTSCSESSNFLQRNDALTQKVADTFFPAAIDFHRRHTLFTELLMCFIIPIVAVLLVLLAILWAIRTSFRSAPATVNLESAT